MVKIKVSLSVDPYKWQTAKKLGINGSEAFESLLTGYISQKSPDNIDIIQLNDEIDKIRGEMEEKSLQLEEKLQMKVAFEQKLKNHDKNELQRKLKLAETVKRSGVLQRS